tara:strand:+ start:108 stop:422 length:315 start_codon:yes stop_codon:yes gene_type:complete
MIDYTNDELRLLLDSERLDIELAEAEKVYQKHKLNDQRRYNRYESRGIGYILEPENQMNWSDRSKLYPHNDIIIPAPSLSYHIKSLVLVRSISFVCLCLWVMTW